MVKLSLSLWDIAGQERFEFFKTDFYKGCAAVGLVFDLARPETFEHVELISGDIREKSGNIPIILVGNKEDLTEDIGETISRDETIDFVNKHNLFEYIETSALENKNVNYLFNRLAITSLLDLQPRRGEINPNDYNHFRFKILLVGDAAVGKSSLISTFVKQGFQEDYKLTIGIDFMERDFEIPDEDLTIEVKEKIREAIDTYKKSYGRDSEEPEQIPIKIEPIEKIDVQLPTETALNNLEVSESNQIKELDIKTTKIFSHKYVYTTIGIVIISIIVSFILHVIGFF